MKIFYAVLCTALLSGSFFSCKKDKKETDTPDNQVPVGIVTPVGTPDGTPIASKTIGTAGGSLLSDDGSVKVIIPAGALAADQAIRIQRISNQNPLGKNMAYRFEPHGIQFSKPVSIQFSFEESDLQNTLAEALAIAYQDNAGIWQARGGVVLDKVNSTVTATATHFSDWSLFESFYLYFSSAVAPVKSTVDLEVFTAEDLFVPLTPDKETPIGKKVSIAASAVKEWKLAGAGNLRPTGPKAVYTAPATVPASPNPVAVSVKLDLRQRGVFMLVCQIEITDDYGEIEIKVGDGGWKKKIASGANVLSDNYYAIADYDGDTEGSYVFITWEGGVGTHPFKSPTENKGTHAHYLVTGGNNYVCYYVNDQDQLVKSGGGVTITSMGEDDGFVKGTFSISPAGYGPDLKQKMGIQGKFRAKRTW
ncbi:MAG: hypothetical protein QM781_12200 [Chitinophagaceae bacterium]